MRHLTLLFLFTLISACAGHSNLQRVIHQEDGLIVVLDKGEIQASPPFNPPYQHPAAISPQDIQKVLEAVEVSPRGGILMSIFSKKKAETLFPKRAAHLVATQLSQALSKADSSERVNFYQTRPLNSVKNAATSGFILVRDERIHLRLNHYKVPQRKGTPPSSIGQDIKPSESGRYRFSLLEKKGMTHRAYKGMLGLSGTDSHWLVIDYAHVDEPKKRATPPTSLEERLRVLKRLREEGLITEKEYIDKKQSILRDF